MEDAIAGVYKRMRFGFSNDIFSAFGHRSFIDLDDEIAHGMTLYPYFRWRFEIIFGVYVGKAYRSHGNVEPNAGYRESKSAVL